MIATVPPFVFAIGDRVSVCAHDPEDDLGDGAISGLYVEDGEPFYRVCLDNGPPVEVPEVALDLSTDTEEARQAPEGTMHKVRREVQRPNVIPRPKSRQYQDGPQDGVQVGPLEPMPEIDAVVVATRLRWQLATLREAVRPILAAYRSTGDGHITEEQITRAWAAFDGSSPGETPNGPERGKR